MKDKTKKVFAKIRNNILNQLESLKAEYKNSENHAMFILSFILNSRLVIILLAFILMIKTILFYKNINLDIDYLELTSFITLQFILIMIIPIFAIKKGKYRFWIIILYDILFGIMLFADNMYYEYSSSMLSVSQIAYLKYSEEIRRNTSLYIQNKYFALFYRYTNINCYLEIIE